MINRFNIEVSISYGDDDGWEDDEPVAVHSEVEDKAGDFCYYSDVEREIGRLEAKIKELEQQLMENKT